jgi:UDP-2,3-diacylglucosamine pyrophosphatase LpxH
MLAIVSDLHITDGTTANNVNPEAFELLGADVLEAAERRGAREIHLVLLGDILDLVRTDYWHRSGIPMRLRPWGGTLDPRTGMNRDDTAVREQFHAVLGGILATPTAVALGETLATLAAGPVPFRATYVVGNHERVMWNFPSLQEAVRAAMPPIAAFARQVESAEYGVLARHGHEWDEHSHGWQFRRTVLSPGAETDRFAPEAYEVMAIGEAVTAELLGGLVYHARDLGAPVSLVDQLKDVNNLRPLLDAFAWLEWIGGVRERDHRGMLHESLKRALDGLLETSLARQWDHLRTDTLVSGDLVDRLEQARAFLLGPDFESFRGRVQGLGRLQRLLPALQPAEEGLLAGARSEAASNQATGQDGIQRVIYGHTHRARHDYFSSGPDGTVRMYINTGTFLPLISRAADRRSFSSALQMTMVFVYRSNEDTQRKRAGTSSLDIWNGTRHKLYA